MDCNSSLNSDATQKKELRDSFFAIFLKSKIYVASCVSGFSKSLCKYVGLSYDQMHNSSVELNELLKTLDKQSNLCTLSPKANEKINGTIKAPSICDIKSL